MLPIFLERYIAKQSGFYIYEALAKVRDITSTYFEGQAKANPKAQFGRSKEKRSDAKLLTLALIVDSLGFAKYSEFFPAVAGFGNLSFEAVEK